MVIDIELAREAVHRGLDRTIGWCNFSLLSGNLDVALVEKRNTDLAVYWNNSLLALGLWKNLEK